MTKFNPILQDFPTTINVDGKSFLIDTDFKLFIKLLNYIKVEDEEAIYLTVSEIFKGELVITSLNAEKIMTALSDFILLADIKTADQTPHKQLFDMFMDSDVIYSDFRRKDIYDIDLNDCKMHWLKFKMLLNGLPENSSVEKRKTLRGLKPKDVDSAQRQELINVQNALKIPTKETIEQENALELIKKLRG